MFTISYSTGRVTPEINSAGKTDGSCIGRPKRQGAGNMPKPPLLMGLVLLMVYVHLTGCYRQDGEKTLFEELPAAQTAIHFANNLSYTRELNPYTYRNFYNGGGVGIGDFNNDGLQDIFFTGNQVPNKLYLNRGNFRFDDITSKAGVASEGVWSTGVSIADVNGDGLPDIYVCKSGSPGGKNRHNELFINNGDSTFTEQAAEYGLDIVGLATDAHFFDYDRDGDLDMYLLNNSFEPVTAVQPTPGLRKQPDPKGGDRLYRNEKITGTDTTGSQTVFTDVTREAGIYSSRIGFGLDVIAGDVNQDGWTDLYITNDFFERDYLYLNNRDGSFREVLTEIMASISLSSMGGDIGDINHDGYPEIYVTDMLPESPERSKAKTAFDFWDEYSERIKNGYFYQFVRNTLQLNRGPVPDSKDTEVAFSEISRMTGTEATDWSWTALFADLDMNGFNDIYVTNGIYKDLTDQDYTSDHNSMRKLRSVIEDDKPVGILFDDIPSTPVGNYAFSGDSTLDFQSRAREWGLGNPGFSNGAAYGDLDNDGDLDLVVNNVNGLASVYKNRSEKILSERRSLILELKGNRFNTRAVGAAIYAWHKGRLYYREQMPNRGFQSSVEPRVHIGFGQATTIDSLIVEWPGGGVTRLEEVETGQIMSLEEPKSHKYKKEEHRSYTGHPDLQNASGKVKQLFREITATVGLKYRHDENDFNEFNRNRLVYEMHSTEGPASCVGDINGDGLDDLYLGGAKGQPGSIFVQQNSRDFRSLNRDEFERDKESEDTDCTWFDANGDGRLDLYVTSGGSEFPSSSSALADRLYLQEGEGFIQHPLNLPPSRYKVNASVSAADADGDGDIDLFIGERLKPFAYGVPASGHILLNDGNGQFTDQTAKVASGLRDIGLLTDSRWADIDGDGDEDLILAGEWMPLTVFRNELGQTGDLSFQNITDSLEMAGTSGLWKSLEVADLDGDGYPEIIGGNYGSNSRFRAKTKGPLNLWVNDFDGNGSVEQILSRPEGDEDIPLVLKQDFEARMPRLAGKTGSYSAYSGKSINDLFTGDQLEDAIVHKIEVMKSMIFWNNRGSAFVGQNLPFEAQISPVFAAFVIGGREKKNSYLLTAGNLEAVKPQFGAYRSGYGSTARVQKDRSLSSLSLLESGFFVKGEVRGIHRLKTGGEEIILVVRNNDTPLWFKEN